MRFVRFPGQSQNRHSIDPGGNSAADPTAAAGPGHFRFGQQSLALFLPERRGLATPMPD